MPGRCSKRAQPGSSASIAIATRSTWRARRSRRGAIAWSWCTPTTGRSATCSIAGTSTWWTARSRISACPRCSSMRPDADSASSATSRSTCAWIGAKGDTAADLVARASERELADAIYAYGEERFSRRIARAIVEARGESPIATTGRLAAIVRRAIPRRGFMRIDPATRTFQALRIWVNRELEGLDRFVELAAKGCAWRRGSSSSPSIRSKIGS